MKVTFTGTGTSQGVPVIACDCEVCTSLDFRDKRLRTSVHIEVDGKSFVIDTGPDFRQQMLSNRIKTLDAVLFTHAHKDHTAGLDDIRAFNFRQKKDMPIYGSQQVLDQLKMEFSYIFQENKYPGVPMIETHTIDSEPFSIQGVGITPIDVMHLKLPVHGFRIKDFTYITDTNFISEASIAKIKGSKVLVLNALQKDSHISHFNLDEAIAMAQKVGAPKTYFTHISHRMGLHRDVEKELPEGILFAYDELTIEI